MSPAARKDERSAKSAGKKDGFTAEEKAAMRARARELKSKADGESELQASLAAMAPHDRKLGKRIHAIITESAPDRDASIRALEAIAGDKDRTAAATGAKLALANAGDLRVQAWLEADLLSTDPALRVGAVTALAALGRAGRGAPVLADADPSLRTRAACTILLAPRSSRH